MRRVTESEKCCSCISLLVVALMSMGVPACGSNPTSPSPTPSPTAAPAEPAVPFRVFGVVTNDDGAPVADALIALTYQPELTAIQTASGRTGADGRYELQLTAQRPGNDSAVVRIFSSERYAPFEQFVRVVENTEKDFRLKPIRILTAGQSTTVRVDSDSSVCSSVGIGGLCEWIRIQPPAEFTYTLDVKATGNGGVV